jgi:hypothetical protein
MYWAILNNNIVKTILKVHCLNMQSICTIVFEVQDSCIRNFDYMTCQTFDGMAVQTHFYKDEIFIFKSKKQAETALLLR